MSPTNPFSAVCISAAKSIPRLAFSALAFCLSLYGGQISSSTFSSDAAVVDFSNLTGGNCNLCGPTLSNQYASLGVTFNNPSFPGQDTVDTNLAAFMPEFPFPNTLYVYQGGLIGQAPATPFQIMFSVPVTTVGFDYGSSPGAYLEVDIFGTSNQWIDTMFFVGNSAPIGLDGFAGIQESSPITRLDLSYHPNSDPSRTLSFALDDIRFEGISAPEPSTVAMVAISLLGLVLLRPRKPRSRPL